jgi:DNA-binding Lrp family transcriptional regulator
MLELYNNETLEFEGRAPSDFWFACVDIAVIKDSTLSTCDKAVYSVICAHVNVRTRACPLRVKTIAEEANCSVRSVQESLKTLVERGVVERAQCFENGQQKASVYKIIGYRAQCYRGADSAVSANSVDFRGAGDAGGAKNDASKGAYSTPIPGFCTLRDAKNDVLSLREPNIYENKAASPSERGTSSPRGANFEEVITPGETANPSEGSSCTNGDDLIAPDEAPPAMRETVEYFLLKTGRTGIQPEELSALRALEEIHTPARVNKEIAQAVERFEKNDKPLSSLTLVYIYKSLQYQNSRKHIPGKSPPKRSTSVGGFREMEENIPDPYAGAYL